MKYHVLSNNLLVKPIKDDKIIIPDEALGRGVIRGLVVHAGNGRYEYGKFVMNPIQEDDYVWFDVADAKRITLEEREYYFISSDAVLIREEK